MMVKGLAWREGAEEGLAVEVTCGRLSHGYTGCQALFWRSAKSSYSCLRAAFVDPAVGNC
jgi:hypothetical protein